MHAAAVVWQQRASAPHADQPVAVPFRLPGMCRTHACCPCRWTRRCGCCGFPASCRSSGGGSCPAHTSAAAAESERALAGSCGRWAGRHRCICLRAAGAPLPLSTSHTAVSLGAPCPAEILTQTPACSAGQCAQVYKMEGSAKHEARGTRQKDTCIKNTEPTQDWTGDIHSVTRPVSAAARRRRRRQRPRQEPWRLPWR
jgi:hypothetical protein